MAITAAALVALSPSGLHPQGSNPTSARQRSNRFTSYSRSIQFKADSVMYLMRVANAGMATASPDARIALLDSIAHRMTTLAGDFDAVAPPSTFERLHDQLVAPLRSVSAKFTRIAALLNLNCSTEQRAGLGCDEARLRLEGAEEALLVLHTVGGELQEYSDARHRAQTMLSAQGVNLPDFTAIRGQ